MLKKILLFLIFTTISGYAQDSTWYRTYHEFNNWPSAVIETNDNGYVVTGKMNQDIFNQDIFLMKTDNIGNMVWRHSYGGNHGDDARAVAQTTDNNFIIVGSSNSSPDSLYPEIYVIKVDSSGNTLWIKYYGEQNWMDIGSSVQSTSDKNYLISFSAKANSGLDSIGIMKINQDGEKIWSKLLDKGYSHNIVQTSDGSYAILYNKYFEDIQAAGFSLIITDSTGNIIVQKDYKEFHDAIGNSIQKTNDDGFIICASMHSSDLKVILTKTDSKGEYQWSKMYDGSLDYDVVSINQTKDNNYVIAGWDDMTFDIFLYKLSEKGEIIWKKYFLDGSCIAGSIIATNDDGYLICGYSNSFSEDHHYQTILIKTDSSGSNLTNEPSAVNYSTETNVIDYQLAQNYPNPFNPTTTISYQIAQAGFVSLKVYDILGREVAALMNEEIPAGNYQVEFESKGLPSGIYFYKLQAGDFVEAKKMVLIK